MWKLHNSGGLVEEYMPPELGFAIKELINKMYQCLNNDENDCDVRICVL
ncbi:unnamed protein product [Brassica napus]|uniref:(rape) hypothetical protein n=1 Tax=Brassica napus TaxID=3708 RepID=A0A817A3I9_BRANA|nr:unnamed protein product [Brassica napus]